MTIIKEEVLAHLNKELYRTEDDIDEYILAALKDLSMRDDFVWIETTVPTIVGRPYYSEPLDFRHLLTVKLAGERPLGKISWAEYQLLVYGDVEANWSEPNRFTRHGGFWYPYPTPDKEYIATLHYCAFVPESEVIDEEEVKAVDNIDHYFSDIYRRAINTLTKAYYCRSKEMKASSAEYLMEFKMDILPDLSKLVKRKPKFTRYTDL